MASIKVKFQPSTVAGHEGTIFYQILHDRKQRQLYTTYHVLPSEWDERRSMVTTTRQSPRKPLILSIHERIRCDVEILTKIVRKLDNSGLSYEADDVVVEFNNYVKEYTLFNFMEGIIIKLRQNGKIRTSETYTAALKSFRNFRKEQDLLLDALTSEIMESYEAWQKSRGNSANTISFYTRILRAVYRRAVDDGIIDDRKPFRRVYTGVDKTVKRALPLAAIKDIHDLDLTRNPNEDYARDMFMMSFMLRGMSFVDMAFLKKADLIDGHIVYRRRKTGQQLTIQWTKQMQMILDKYPENRSDYLLPIIRNKGVDDRRIYRNAGTAINNGLKRVAARVGVTVPLTLYVARHSWASAAKNKGVPVSVISEGMGHDSETTTKIYLASLDTSVVDRANSLILESL